MDAAPRLFAPGPPATVPGGLPLLLLLAGLATAPPPAAGARIMDLGGLDPETVFSHALGVSGDGSVVVGQSLVPGVGDTAFRWTEGGGMTALPSLPGGGDPSEARAASTTGATVVGWGNPALGEAEAFRWTAGGGTGGLGDFEGVPVNSKAYGVSAGGDLVVGYGNSLLGGRQAALWDGAGNMTSIAPIPGSTAWGISDDGGVAVGSADLGSGEEAFRWTATGGLQGLGSLSATRFYSRAYGASADGAVAVGETNISTFLGTGTVGFRWTAGGGMQPIGELPGGTVMSSASAVSDDGQVIVGTSSAASGQEAFIWREGLGMMSLEDVLAQEYGLDLTGWQLRQATGVSADGKVIVGFGGHDGVTDVAWRVVIPLPGALPLLASALGAGLVLLGPGMGARHLRTG